jgi:hypothetical protein
MPQPLCMAVVLQAVIVPVDTAFVSSGCSALEPFNHTSDALAMPLLLPCFLYAAEACGCSGA